MKVRGLLLLSMLIWQMSVSAFIENGLIFSVEDKNATEARVDGYDASLYGDVTIPETVTHTYTKWNSEKLEWETESVHTYQVTSIKKSAFNLCNSITSITIPNSVREIGSAAFYGCAKLKSVVLPEGITSIGYNTFDDCGSLESVFIPSSVRSIGSYAFNKCISLTSIVIPEGVELLEKGTFSECTNLTSVTIPQSLKTIDNYAFSRCGLKEIVLPEGVESIGKNVFYYCKNLTKVTLPNSLKAIGEHAFTDLPELTTIVSYIEKPFDLGMIPIVYASDGSGMGRKNITIYIPANTLNKYKMAKGWSYYEDNRTRQTTLVEFDSEDYTDANNVIYTYSPHATKAYVKSGTFDLDSRIITIASPHTGSDVVIPSTITANGKSYTVSSIGRFALAGPTPETKEFDGQVRHLTLPETIEFVDLWALCGQMETVVCLSPTPPAVYNQHGLHSLLHNGKNATTLRVPKGSGDSYREAIGWNEFNHITEIGNNPLADVDPVESEMEVKPSSLTRQNLIDNVINSVYYNLGSDACEYSSIHIKYPTDMTKIADATPGSDDIWKYFTGIILKVGKGKGTIRVSVKTSGNLQLVTQVGNQKPVVASKAEMDDVVVDYDVTESTYVYIYAIDGGNSARITRSESDTNDMVYIYGITITPDPTGISTVQDSPATPVRCYSLDGREIQNNPTKPGIYIVNGRKIILPSIKLAPPSTR